jgi:hypothetical protein
MTPGQIQARALEVAAAVADRRPVEDSLVELKATWPDDHWKAARRIAGHANAAGGNAVLWLIGLDEKRGVTGADRIELANWWPKVQSCFGGASPTVTDVNVTIDNGQTFVALYFECAGRPFVVSLPPGSTTDRDVPWREGTRIRSATRSELIRLLGRAPRVGELECRSVEVCGSSRDDGRIGFSVNASVRLLGGDFPIHLDVTRSRGTFRSGPLVVELAAFSIDGRPRDNPNVRRGDTTVTLMGPADLDVYLEAKLSRPVVWEAIPGNLRLELSVIDATAPLIVSLDVANETSRSGACEAYWILGDDRQQGPMVRWV